MKAGFDDTTAPAGSGDFYGDDLAGKLERCGRFLACCQGKRRGQEKILRILCEQNGISQKELQERLGIQPGSMSEIAAKLEARGLIARGRDGADRRKILLSITGEGRDWLARRQDAEHVRRRRAEWFSALSEQEQETLGTLLDQLAADWERRSEGARRR